MRVMRCSAPVLVILFSTSLALGQMRPVPQPPEGRGFGPFLCEGQCKDLSYSIDYYNDPLVVGKAGSYVGVQGGQRLTLATSSAGGGFSNVFVASSGTEPYPVTPIFVARLPQYSGQPNPNYVEIGFSATPFVVLYGAAQPFGTDGIGLATDCRVYQCPVNDPGCNAPSDWETIDFTFCSGLERSNNQFLRPWFFSVYKSGQGATQTQAVSYHGYVRVDNEGTPRDVWVRLGVAGKRLPNTDPSSFATLTSPHAIIAY